MFGINLAAGDAPMPPLTGGEEVQQNNSDRHRKPKDKGTIVNPTGIFVGQNMSSGIPVHNPSGSKIGQLRGPWVPAPAKASSTTVESKQVSKTFTAAASSSSSYNSLKAKPKSFTNSLHNSKTKFLMSQTSSTQATQKFKNKDNRVSRKPTSKGKNRRPASSYRLQSKDSLVDVTACLQAKRADVMKLWEKSLLKDDPNLLSQIEKANRLALEAAEEVETLRRRIQDFQQKEEGLSEDDCIQLEKMRSNVLEKVKEFEEVDNILQESIAKRSVSKTSIVSATSKTSQTGMDEQQIPTQSSAMHLPLSRKSQSAQSTEDLIFLKETRNDFSDESKSEHEESEDEIEGKRQIYFSDKSTLASAATSSENLNRLKKMYDESLTFPPLNMETIVIGESLRNVRIANENENIRKESKDNLRSHRTVRFTTEDHPFELESEAVPEDNIVSETDELYNAKISNLQKKLMDTEQEVEELKSEMERIESDANFHVRMLQNTVEDKFDSLKAIPEYLQIVDQRLHESAQLNGQLERALKEKEMKLREELECNRKMKKEMEELRDKLRTAENFRDFTLFKNTELEKTNMKLRKDMDDITKQISEMATQVRIAKDKELNASFLSARSSRTTQSYENKKLQLKCSELKDQLAQSKRIIQHLKKSKAKLNTGLNKRIEELIAALQQAQSHKNQLCDQIRYLKKSYNELFPPGIFDSPPNKKSSSHKKKHYKQKGAEEQTIEPKVTWQTGKSNREKSAGEENYE